MEPFHVTCETCHARLKIRSVNVIGEIHACPKCESMVHIVPPAGWVPPAESVAADMPAVVTAAVSASEFPAARATMPLFAWGIGAATAVVLAAVAVIMLLPGGDAADAPAAHEFASVEPEIDAPESSEGPPETRPIDDPVADAPSVDMPDELSAEFSASPQLASDVSAELTAVDVEAAEPPAEAAATPETVVASEPPAPPARAPSPPAGDKRTPIMKFDPLDFDPSQLSLGVATDSPADVVKSSVAGGESPELTGAVAAAMPDGEPPADVGAGVPSVTVRVGPAPTSPPEQHSVAEQLAAPIDSLDMPAVPLVKLVDIVAEMADVPITIDPASLAMVGLSSRTDVAVQARNTTLDRLLTDALTKQRLDFVERDGQVVIVKPNADDRRSVDYDVKDLLEPGALDAADVAKLVERIVAPASWRRGPNGGTIEVDGTKLRVEQTNRVQIQILLFCERLRLARGLALRSRYPASLLSADSSYTRLSNKLGKSTTFTYLPWTRLTDVVRHWQESAGVTILVDWTAIAKEELTPSTPIACSVVGRPWDASLDAVLEPLGLAWWAVDGETIQITSQAALVEIEQIEFYSVPKPVRKQFANMGKLIEALRKELSEHADDGGGAAAIDTQIELDALSGRLIVLGSPATHRHLEDQVERLSPQRHDEHDDFTTNATPAGTP